MTQKIPRLGSSLFLPSSASAAASAFASASVSDTWIGDF